MPEQRQKKDSRHINEQLSEEEIQDKVQQYATFIDKTLHPDLKAAVDEKENVESDIDEYHDLMDQLSILHKRNQSVKDEKKEGISSSINDASCSSASREKKNTALVDLGNKLCYCQATFNDPTKVYVHVGMGFHTEFSLPEAITFCKKRIKFLSNEVLPLKQRKAQSIAFHLESALMLVDSLQQQILGKNEESG